MEQEKVSNLSLEQKVLAAATGIFAGFGTLWSIDYIPDVMRQGSANLRDTVFNVGVLALAYVSAAASLYLVKRFPDKSDSQSLQNSDHISLN
jgi:hypothetical protein